MLSNRFASSANFVGWVQSNANTADFAREYQAIAYAYPDGSRDSKTRRGATRSRTVGSALRSAANGGGVNLLRREKIDSVGGVTITVQFLP